MKKQTKDFLEKIKKDRQETLMALVMDVQYFSQFLARNNEEEVREMLAEENKKKVVLEDGKIEDNRDKDKVRDLENRINRIEKVKQQIEEYKMVLNESAEYFNYIVTLPDELVASMERAAQLK